MISSQVRQHKYYVTWFQQTVSLGATLLPREYFPTRLKACNYCMYELQRVACNRGLIAHETTALEQPTVSHCSRDRHLRRPSLYCCI